MYIYYVDGLLSCCSVYQVSACRFSLCQNVLCIYVQYVLPGPQVQLLPAMKSMELLTVYQVL